MQIINPGDPASINEPTAVALGSFDGVHLGHQAVIGAARNTGLKTVVVTFRQHPCEVLEKKSVRILMNRPLKEKVMEQIGVETLAFLDFKSIMEMSPEEFLRDVVLNEFRAAKVFCGFNYRFGKGRSAGVRELREICARLGAEGSCIAPFCAGGEPVSSTRIRKLIGEGKVSAAAKLLGRPFSILFEVVNGRKLGRTLGTPTINQLFPESFILPRFGVYASMASVDGKWLPSVTNIGVKPTVGSSCVSAETYILNYRGDLYGKWVEVRLYDFLRPEKKFKSLEELKAQIVQDAFEAGSLTARLSGSGG